MLIYVLVYCGILVSNMYGLKYYKDKDFYFINNCLDIKILLQNIPQSIWVKSAQCISSYLLKWFYKNVVIKSLHLRLLSIIHHIISMCRLSCVCLTFTSEVGRTLTNKSNKLPSKNFPLYQSFILTLQSLIIFIHQSTILFILLTTLPNNEHNR